MPVRCPMQGGAVVRDRLKHVLPENQLIGVHWRLCRAAFGSNFGQFGWHGRRSQRLLLHELRGGQTA
jgi:hypothetical protein